MNHIKYRVHIEQDEDGIFVAEVPAFPRCVSQGQTRRDALSNAREAIGSRLRRFLKGLSIFLVDTL